MKLAFSGHKNATSSTPPAVSKQRYTMCSPAGTNRIARRCATVTYCVGLSVFSYPGFCTSQRTSESEPRELESPTESFHNWRQTSSNVARWKQLQLTSRASEPVPGQLELFPESKVRPESLPPGFLL